MTRHTRMCRPARARRCCFAWPIRTTRWCSAPAICRNWRSAGAPMASAIRCRITTSTPPCRRRSSSISSAGARATRASAPRRSPCLQDILATEISPELVPGDGAAAQRTEDFVGPYALQDFNLFYATRYGFAPSKIAFLAFHAWRDAGDGRLAFRHAGRPARRLRSSHDQALAWRVLAPLLRDQPVQTKRHAERSEGEFRRFAVAARRLARAERFLRRRLARRSGRRSLTSADSPASVPRQLRESTRYWRRFTCLRRPTGRSPPFSYLSFIKASPTACPADLSGAASASSEGGASNTPSALVAAPKTLFPSTRTAPEATSRNASG